ncbi:hypothetical protein JOF48_000219 [Arthrobacter stackebrandtii]|uniref:Glycoside hydrolase 123-like N-terminal domain-containing protein n=1 Tax=Arthrobacter stackebrandtii TaxID=272161 RepID=A0ABS4YS50_9MICC|nr:glycoside hydrolase domain-containing protein [Arthrobacter stackebrandtii]MBP2411420.1 hypothetical protein [Arthrobacter stackebrandtii]PYH00295.1 hypothetical protein CVV67_11115 [Arthrobacter stackebrandtii]
MRTPATATSTPSTLAATQPLHPELECGVGEWDKLLYGNHRIVVNVSEVPAGRPGNSVVLPWRRQDENPAEVDTIVVSAATGTRVLNVVRTAATSERGEFTFEPVDGPGEYHFYYLPYVMGGRSYYPQASYLPARPTANPGWVKSVVTSVWSFESAFSDSRLPAAQALRYEAASEWDSFAPMNFTATAGELETLHAAHSGAPFMVFAEDRSHAISMTGRLPARWAIGGPAAVAGEDGAPRLTGSAQPGEDHVLQLGLYAVDALDDVQVTVAACATAGNAEIEVAARCINTAGVDRLGVPFSKDLAVGQGRVQALFIIVPVPSEAGGGTLDLTVRIGAAGTSATIPVTLNIAPEADADIPAGGFGDPRQLRRLAWLDSTLAIDDELVRPFTAIELDAPARTLGILGRTLTLAANGLPAQIGSTFTPEVTGVDGPLRTLLAGAFSLETRGAGAWTFGEIDFTVHGPARTSWRCQWHNAARGLSATVHGELEADGAATFAVRLANPGGGGVELGDVRLSVPCLAESVPLSMGLGTTGGRRMESLDWSWDVADRNQESLWLGDANIGAQIAFRDDNYERPLNTNFYHEKPLIEPVSWGNHGSSEAGITLRETVGEGGSGVVLLEAFSGPRTLAGGESLNYGFRLLLTPFKPIDPARQLRNRYFHDQGTVSDIAATGASVINIHHATALAPFINDPLLHADTLAEYTAAAHAAGLKVKVYDTVRELTAHSPDLLPMASLNGEIFSDGPGKGHIWPQEHVGANYVSAWYAPTVDDISIVTAGESRLQNWYIRGLDELVRRTGLDGLYLDDIAYDRQAMKRVRKVLQNRCAEPEIDIHSANQFNERDGFNPSANLYMEQLPYTDRLWLGEYFDYDNTDPAYWLVEVSGIPFGLMGEMLEGGGNPWRGLVFGMTGRAPRVDNRPLWAFWAGHGLADAPMVGHWAGAAVPVRTSDPDVLATSWLTPGGLVTALASWAPEPVDVTLEFAPEYAHLAAAAVSAPAIDGFQGAADFAPGAAVTVEPRKGVVLVVGAP